MKAKELFLISYLPTLAEVQTVLDNKINQIDRYAYILHDKDTYDKNIIDKDTGVILHSEGEDKAQHIHIYIKLENSRDIDEVKRWFVRKDENGKDINCLREIVKNRVSAFHYLIHDTKTSKHKYQYDINEVISYNMENIEDSEDEPFDETYQIVCDMVKGVDKTIILKRYGKQFIYHYNSFKMFYEDIAGLYTVQDGNLYLRSIGYEKSPFDSL